MSFEIVVNGRPRMVPPDCTLAGLLRDARQDPRWIVAELNGEPLPRDEFEGTVLKPGDRLEIVRPVAGG